MYIVVFNKLKLLIVIMFVECYMDGRWILFVIGFLKLLKI